MSERSSLLDRRVVRRHFDAAAGSYEAAATLQNSARHELLQRLDYFKLQPRVIVDLGCGTGAGSAALKRRYPRSQVVALDLAPAMLRAARARRWPWRHYSLLAADAHALPFAAQSVDLMFSNLMLQWSDAPRVLMAECQRVLRTGGLWLFSSFGPDTLHELRAAWGAADRNTHVSDFPDAPWLASSLQQVGLAEPVIDTETCVRHYADTRALMLELRHLGANNAATHRPRGLTTARRLLQMSSAYEQHRQPEGLPASWQLIFGAVFAGRPADDDDTTRAGETLFPLASLRLRPRG